MIIPGSQLSSFLPTAIIRAWSLCSLSSSTSNNTSLSSLDEYGLILPSEL